MLSHAYSHFFVLLLDTLLIEVDQEEAVDKTLDKEWYEVLRIILNCLLFLMRCGAQPQVLIRRLRRVSNKRPPSYPSLHLDLRCPEQNRTLH